MKKIKKGDKVQVMRGKDAGKHGEVLKLIVSETATKVVVAGVNITKKAVKPNQQLGIKGGLVEFEKAIDISNVMLLDPKDNKPVRVGFKKDEKTGKKVRISKRTGEIIN